MSRGGELEASQKIVNDSSVSDAAKGVTSASGCNGGAGNESRKERDKLGLGESEGAPKLVESHVDINDINYSSIQEHRLSYQDQGVDWYI